MQNVRKRKINKRRNKNKLMIIIDTKRLVAHYINSHLLQKGFDLESIMKTLQYQEDEYLNKPLTFKIEKSTN